MSGWHYSNINYILAGMIIQKVTGHSPIDKVRRRILVPLGKPELDLMELVVGPVVEMRPIAAVTDQERMEVTVRPARRRLEDQVELVEPDRAGDEQPAPDLRAMVYQGDPYPEHVRA